MSAWNCEPMMPTFTLPSAISVSASKIRLSTAKQAALRLRLGCKTAALPGYDEVPWSSQPTYSWRIRLPL